jgi:flagellar biosynthesis protein FliQ
VQLPKLIGVAVVVLAVLPWILQLFVQYTIELFRGLPGMIG